MLISAEAHLTSAEKVANTMISNSERLSPEKQAKMNELLTTIEDVRDNLRPLQKAKRFRKKADGGILTAEDFTIARNILHNCYITNTIVSNIRNAI